MLMNTIIMKIILMKIKISKNNDNNAIQNYKNNE